MSLNVLNNKFLSVLDQLSIEVDQFPDKSFDGLFESMHDGLNCFLEWFVENFTSENALTEAELDICDIFDISVGTLDEFDEEELEQGRGRDEEEEDEEEDEPDVDPTNDNPSYYDLESLNGNCIKSLAADLEKLTKEFDQLQDICLDLDTKHIELKKRSQDLKEECSTLKEKFNESKEELRLLNSSFSTVDDEIGHFNLSSFNDLQSITAFKNMIKEENLAWNFKIKTAEDNFSSLLSTDNNIAEFANLKTSYQTSKVTAIMSQCSSSETTYKILRATDFLDKLKEESNAHFNFVEMLSIFCDPDELTTFDQLKEEVEVTLANNLALLAHEECELIWHRFLSGCFSRDSSKNEAEISKYEEVLSLMKFDISNNILWAQVIDQLIENEKKCSRLIDTLYSSIRDQVERIKNASDSLRWKNKTYPERVRQLNEKHPLLEAYKNMRSTDGEKSQENAILRVSDTVKNLISDPNFCPESFFNELENVVSSAVSYIACGPTSQIQLAPVALRMKFNKCELFLLEFSRMVQRLLTDYVNTKEGTSGRERKKQLLWVEFLMNPQVLAKEMGELLQKTVNYSLGLS